MPRPEEPKPASPTLAISTDLRSFRLPLVGFPTVTLSGHPDGFPHAKALTGRTLPAGRHQGQSQSRPTPQRWCASLLSHAGRTGTALSAENPAAGRDSAPC